MHYRVYSSRFDVEETVYEEFEAKNDEEAKKRFDEIVELPANAWDRMRMVCIEQVEKSRPVAVNANLQRVLDS